MISVIVPTLNESAYISKLLEGLAHQESITQVIIVDGASDDGTIDIAAQCARRWNLPLSHARVDQRDVAIQRNHGAKMATNKWLLFLDADVLVPDDFAAKALNEAKRRNCAISGARFFAAEGNYFYRSIYWLYAMVVYPIIRWFNPILHGCAILIQKDLHEKIGGFQPGITFEDYDYSRRASVHSRPALLRSCAVRTSARRFYNASFSDVFELLFGTVQSILSGKKIENRSLVQYHEKSGNHPSPRY